MNGMKKTVIILFLFSMCMMPCFAQQNRFFLYTQEGLKVTTLSLNVQSDNKEKDFRTGSKSQVLSIGTGYYFNDFGVDVGVFFLDQSGNDYIAGARIGAIHYAPITSNLYWGVSVAYRRIKYFVDGRSDPFHELYAEPLIFELRSKDKHWGFQASLVSFEAMIKRIEPELDIKTNNKPVTTVESEIMSGYGASFNNFNFKVILYM